MLIVLAIKGGEMKTLIISTNNYFIDEIKDYFSLYNNSLLFAKNKREAFKILNKHTLDYVIVELSSLKELEIIKYINENYQLTNIILIIGKTFNKQISIIKNGNFNIIEQPFRLQEFKKYIKLMEEK
jgi:DNA-binding NtrC family response regulator